MKINILKILTILLIITASHISCGNETPEIKGCDFDNPLTDLLWLKEKTEEIALAIQHGHPLTVSIYQCIYSNRETVFLVDKVNEKSFYNCEGKILETYSELNITDKELIWEIDNDFINTQYPCYCIMDTLRGEWNWVRTFPGIGFIDNAFESIVRILSQNEDESINYEIFVADTLFYRGNFQFQYLHNPVLQWWTIETTVIRFPPKHYPFRNPVFTRHIQLGLEEEFTDGGRIIRQREDIIVFIAFFGTTSPYRYFYQKIKME